MAVHRTAPVMASNASVIDPPPPNRSLTRSSYHSHYDHWIDAHCPLSIRSTVPLRPSTPQEAGELVVSMLEVERQMASPTPYDNQDEIALQQDYDHLKIDYAIALAAYNSFDPDDPRNFRSGLSRGCSGLGQFVWRGPPCFRASVNR